MKNLHKGRSQTLRKGRFSQQGFIYLITTNTHDRHPFFEDFVAGRILVKAMKSFHSSGTVNSLAFVVMPDHLHWLFQLQGNVELSELVRHLKGRSARNINAHLGRTGTVWQTGFHDHALRNDESLCEVARYLVANPLRTGLVKQIGNHALWDAQWLGILEG